MAHWRYPVFPRHLVRITLDIDDSLLIRAKLRAKRERIALSRLIEEALSLRLAWSGMGIGAKVAERRLTEQDISDAVQWARRGQDTDGRRR